MNRIIFSAVLFVAMLFANSAQASGFVYSTKAECEKSTGYYTPSVGLTLAAKVKKFLNWNETSLSTDQCFQTLARENGKDRKGYVRMEKGTKVLRFGDKLVIAECGNEIFTPVQLVVAEPSANIEKELACSENCGGVVTNTTTIKERVVVQCADGTVLRFDGDKKVDPSANCPKIVVQSAVETKTVVATGVSTDCNVNKTSSCKNEEHVTETRKEARTDGRCFVQTNMGYKFELRSERSTGRIMVGLVSPETNKLLEGTKAHYVGNERSTIANRGPDCSADQAKFYKQENWNSVRESFGIPSICKLKKEI